MSSDESWNDQEDDRAYLVVVNDEEQYSLWPEGRETPAGWRQEGTSGTKAECLEHIKAVWTDMRPLSLRRRMEEAASGE
ncbi:MbtH family protein [Streptomyces sp. NPDC088730]|uniref:MbtH family protein n=1 Tax=Streptomyces sp. NPDC088730 TaxID=3365877 RepID=UPI00380F6A02